MSGESCTRNRYLRPICVECDLHFCRVSQIVCGILPSLEFSSLCVEFSNMRSDKMKLWSSSPMKRPSRWRHSRSHGPDALTAVDVTIPARRRTFRSHIRALYQWMLSERVHAFTSGKHGVSCASSFTFLSLVLRYIWYPQLMSRSHRKEEARKSCCCVACVGVASFGLVLPNVRRWRR